MEQQELSVNEGRAVVREYAAIYEELRELVDRLLVPEGLKVAPGDNLTVEEAGDCLDYISTVLNQMDRRLRRGQLRYATYQGMRAIESGER